ncbi:hypothetical protein PUNSTDRAFT_139524 [Punctularia strigosozonata HHB-11173 SS5]|uniref:PWWP domain-containing protein n=1 Tax=Punctularia strigosozonata (strain HHB-11173) TaxID=741275 RepID=R7RZQ8_PUNST|nr:uncharacterized protein PUNSTDRAFT_139524 [Punctularia strigosozonata HHB-11173 SS5]EIN03468.1 hypothetical protein PUNSTDRAFT_139524 [Punctularia strigosozonata HHB-11173 SS5]
MIPTTTKPFSALAAKLRHGNDKVEDRKAKTTVRDGLLAIALPTLALGDPRAARPESWRQPWPYAFRPGDKVWAYTFGAVWRRGTVVGDGAVVRREYDDGFAGEVRGSWRAAFHVDRLPWDGKQHKLRLRPKRQEKEQTKTKAKRELAYYTVEWRDRDGVALRAEFAPALGTLKPDDAHTRDLLAQAHLWVDWAQAEAEDQAEAEAKVEEEPEPEEEIPLTLGREACLAHPVRARQPWPYIFSVGQVAWASKHQGSWHPAVIEETLLERLPHCDAPCLVYIASWTVHGETLRDVFAPTLGELKPDTDHVRALLAAEDATVSHTDQPPCAVPASSGCCPSCRLSKLWEIAKAIGAEKHFEEIVTVRPVPRRRDTGTSDVTVLSDAETVVGDDEEDGGDACGELPTVRVAVRPVPRRLRSGSSTDSEATVVDSADEDEEDEHRRHYRKQPF